MFCSSVAGGQVAIPVWAFVLALPVQKEERFVMRGNSWLGPGREVGGVECKEIGKMWVAKDLRKAFRFDNTPEY